MDFVPDRVPTSCIFGRWQEYFRPRIVAPKGSMLCVMTILVAYSAKVSDVKNDYD